MTVSPDSTPDEDMVEGEHAEHDPDPADLLRPGSDTDLPHEPPVILPGHPDHVEAAENVPQLGDEWDDESPGEAL